MRNQAIDPLKRTDNANFAFTMAICVVALLLLVFGNNLASKNIAFWGTDFDDLLNNVGLALLIAALTQYYTDFRVRGSFYQDISDHIVANETLRDSGILTFYADSKTCLPTSLLRNCHTLDIGMVYSDRFLKDNIGILESRGQDLTIRVYCPDLSKPTVSSVIAKCIGRKPADVIADFNKLKRIADAIKKKNVKVSIYHQDTMPHYSFYVIDDEHFFITMSTFSSRLANVPLFQVNKDSALAKMVMDDIAQIKALNTIAP